MTEVSAICLHATVGSYYILIVVPEYKAPVDFANSTVYTYNSQHIFQLQSSWIHWFFICLTLLFQLTVNDDSDVERWDRGIYKVGNGEHHANLSGEVFDSEDFQTWNISANHSNVTFGLESLDSLLLLRFFLT